MFRRYLFHAATLAGLIVSWSLLVKLFQVPAYVLPDPSSVGLALWDGYVHGTMLSHLVYTANSVLLGYAVGCGTAFVLAIIFSEIPVVDQVLYPYVVAFQAMPKVALAPLIVVWFGFGVASKVFMVAIICFFPLFVNTLVGLRQVDGALLDLMKVFSASRWKILRQIKIPSAASHIFAGLEIAIVLALIGAVVAEFISSTRGLGYLVNAMAVSLDTGVMFAALFSLSALGYAGSALVKHIHHKVVFWNRFEPGTGSGAI
jgi:NitT/TauT family transport system permease protein